MAVTVKYEEFFHLPLKPSKASECLAKCKLCPNGTQPSANESPLKKLALELFSIPSSSAPVERLFSKAGIILNQRRTRLSSSSIEELLAFK